MKIKFDFEGLDEDCAFFALYAGLRMYYEQKIKSTTNDQMSFAAAAAFCMLEDLKVQYEKKYWESAAEYEQIYN